jgi:hypothetical protein
MAQTMWEFNATSSMPIRQQCVAEWLQWLEGVDDPHERARLDSALKGADAAGHFSARLELFLHHALRGAGYSVEWHPTLDSTRKTPDFLVTGGDQEFLVEATISQQESRFREQECFSRKLQRALSVLNLPCEISFSAIDPVPPPSAWNVVWPKINLFVESAGANLSAGAEKEALWTNPTAGARYQVRFTLRGGHGPAQASGVDFILGGSSGMSEKLWDDIRAKANRYGIPDVPFVVALWAMDYPILIDETIPLYGTLAMTLDRGRDGDIIGSSPLAHQPDGIFTISEDGTLGYRHISAVLFYQHRLRDNGPTHLVRVYHNPYATLPLAQSALSDWPQYVPVPDTEAEGHMEWVPTEPQDW